MALLKRKKKAVPKAVKKTTTIKLNDGLQGFYDAYVKGIDLKKGKHNTDAHGIDNVTPVCDLCSKYMKGAKASYAEQQ